MRVHSFEPIADASSRLLILGSMPGKASLQAGQYYAHPRNLFWTVIGSLLGIDPAAPYGQRVARLRDDGIALWDVLANSVRPGSLDADIQMSTAKVNDFVRFLTVHTAIERICFNGQKAAKIFSDRVSQDNIDNRIQLFTLPSTSPAHAAMRFDEKLELWRTGIAHVNRGN